MTLLTSALLVLLPLSSFAQTDIYEYSFSGGKIANLSQKDNDVFGKASVGSFFFLGVIGGGLELSREKRLWVKTALVVTMIGGTASVYETLTKDTTENAELSAELARKIQKYSRIAKIHIKTPNAPPIDSDYISDSEKIVCDECSDERRLLLFSQAIIFGVTFRQSKSIVVKDDTFNFFGEFDVLENREIALDYWSLSFQYLNK